MDNDIDVIIPTFNRLWSIQKVIPHYLGLPRVRRVIVVDDGSIDGTDYWLNVLSSNEPRLIVVRHPKRLGACAARNTGAALAEAPYVFFADDDMLIAPSNAFYILLDEMIKGNADIIAPVLIYPEGIEPNFHAISKKQPDDLLFMYHKISLERKPVDVLLRILPDATFQSAQLPGLMLVRRPVLEKVQYDESLGDNSYRDETDFQFAAIEQGFRLLACTKVYLIDLIRVNDQGGCHSTNLLDYELLCCRNNWKILKKHQRMLKEIGDKTPILMMQLYFCIEHVFYRLPRRILYRIWQNFRLYVKQI